MAIAIEIAVNLPAGVVQANVGQKVTFLTLP